jgi:hypothetical protein
MTENVSYRHICGYPLERGSEMTRCPGCGGRITPWTVKAVEGAFPPQGDEYGSLQHLLRWLAEEKPDMAKELQALLAAEISPAEVDDVEIRERAAALRTAYAVLNRALRREE